MVHTARHTPVRGGSLRPAAAAMPVGQAFAPIPSTPATPQVPGVASVPLLPTGDALGPAAGSIVADAMAEIMSLPTVDRDQIRDVFVKRGADPSPEELDKVVEVVKMEKSGGALSEIENLAASVARIQDRPTSTAVAGADVLTEGDIGLPPAPPTPPAYDFAESGALAPIVIPRDPTMAPIEAFPPAPTPVQTGALVPPTPPPTVAPPPVIPAVETPAAPAAVPDGGVYPPVEPVPTVAPVTPEPTTAAEIGAAAPANSLTSTSGIIQALLKQNKADAATTKALAKQDMGMGLLMAGLKTLGHTPKLGENALAGITTGIQTGINHALSAKSRRVKATDKDFDKRLKVAGLYTDLSVAEAKLQATATDKRLSREERERNNKALEALKGDMNEVRKTANQLTSEKNRIVINKAGADAMESIEKLITEDFEGKLNRNELQQSLVVDAHPGSAVAAKLQRTNYARAVAAIDADLISTPEQKKQRKAEAKRRIDGWLKDWGHKL